jgi:hypothetical protein
MEVVITGKICRPFLAQFLPSLTGTSHVVWRGAPLEMMEGTKGGAQRACSLRPRCISEVVPGPWCQSTIYIYSVCISLDFQSNIHITKMYGTINIKFIKSPLTKQWISTSLKCSEYSQNHHLPHNESWSDEDNVLPAGDEIITAKTLRACCTTSSESSGRVRSNTGNSSSTCLNICKEI